LVMTAMIIWPDEQKTRVFFAGAFAVCGLCSGCYFPVASRRLDDSGFGVGQAGTKLEMSDHLGASVGGILSSLVIIPVLGIRLGLIFMLLLIICNVPSALVTFFKGERVFRQEGIDFNLRRAGYVLLGVGASVILCSNLLTHSVFILTESQPQIPIGQLRIEKISAALGKERRDIAYYKVLGEEGSAAGYVFDSADFAPEVRGFGGPIELSIHVDNEGKLQNFQIVKSNETPSYLAQLDKWMDSLKGRELFKPDALAEIDTVTGATISSSAIIAALEKSGERFYAQVPGSSLKESMQKDFDKSIFIPDTQAIYFVIAIVLTLLVIYFGGFRSRIAVLVFNFVAGGVILNAQYSSEQVVNLLSLQLPAIRFYGPLLLILVVPVIVVLFGNIYCGYLCPFGAAQELLGYCLPMRFKQGVSVESMKRARFVKYVLLFVLTAAFFITRNHRTISIDPLISVFSGQASNLVMIMAMIAAVGSLFYIRFWCRYLCPVGAFLSLLNNLVLLKRFMPTKHFGKCEFGLSGKDKMDCIYCDRCRHGGAGFTPVWRSETQDVPQANILSKYLLPVVVVIALFVAGVVFQESSASLPAGSAAPAISVQSAGQPRDINVEKVRRMIQQGKLSDKEAQFYRESE
ncbi:MAG: 4Fe-4S binding protein, partial [Phycisphaerales bacterium]